MHQSYLTSPRPPFSLHLHALWKHTVNQVCPTNVIEGPKIWARAAVSVDRRLMWKVSEESLIMRIVCDYNLLPLVKELHIQGIVEHLNLYILLPKNEVEINAVYL